MTKLTAFKPMRDELLKLRMENKKLRKKMKAIADIAMPPDTKHSFGKVLSVTIAQGEKLDQIWDITQNE